MIGSRLKRYFVMQSITSCFRMYKIGTRICFTATWTFHVDCSNRACEICALAIYRTIANKFCLQLKFYRIFYRARSLKDLDPHVVLDSNEISGTVIEHEYSPNGEYCAFTISNEIGPSFIHVVEVKTGENYGRSLKFEEISKKIVWSEDSKGFFVYVMSKTNIF